MEKYNQKGVILYENRALRSPREAYLKEHWDPIIFSALEKYCKNKSVADFGSGTGFYTDFISKYAEKAIGLDNSEEMVSYAKQKYPALEFILSDALSTSFGNESLDVAVSLGLLEIVSLPLFLEEIKRILKKDGVAILYGANKYSAARFPLKLFCIVTGRKYLMKEPSKKEMLLLFENNGFELIESRMDDGLIWLPNFVDRAIGKKVYSFIGKFFKFPKENPCSNGIFFVVRKKMASIPALPDKDRRPVRPSRMAKRFFHKLCDSLLFYDQWNIGIVDRPIHDFLESNPVSSARWLPLLPQHKFRADPFGILQNERIYVLFENYNYRTSKGCISATSIRDGSPLLFEEVINAPFHMSYPYLLEYENQIYCIPETYGIRGVSLYKAKSFPNIWEKVATLINDFAGADITVFQHGDHWWLLAADQNDGPSHKLKAWYAPDLLGPWSPHLGNPIKVDVRSARPAGTPFIYNGNLYRPGQDCSKSYGDRIVLNRVTRLTPTEFEEERVAVVEPDKNGPYPDGLHTISGVGDKTLIDGKKRVFIARNPIILIYKLVNKIKGINSGNNRLLSQKQRAQNKESIKTEEIKIFFDKAAVKRNLEFATESILGYEQKVRYEALVLMLDPDSKDVILDVGCGNARDLIELSEKCTKCWGIDLSEGMVKKAREELAENNIKNVEAEFGDATNMRFSDEQFDKVFASEILEHIPDYQGAIKEMARVLKGRGSLVVTTPNRRSWYGFDRFIYGVIGVILRKKWAHPYDCWKTFPELKSALESSGLKVVDVSGFNYLPGFLISYRLPKVIKKILIKFTGKVESKLSKLLPKNGSGICIKAVKSP